MHRHADALDLGLRGLTQDSTAAAPPTPVAIMSAVRRRCASSIALSERSSASRSK